MENKRGQMDVVQQPDVENKSRWWIWLIVVIVLLVIAFGIYFWLTGGDNGTGMGGILGDSLPKPPALPE